MADFRSDPLTFKCKTPSGKIEIFSETIHSFGYSDCPGHPTWLEPKEWLGGKLAGKFPLHMISNQPRNKLHAQLDYSEFSQKSKIAGREPVRINSKDALKREIKTGDVVKIFNDRGAILAGALVCDSIRCGVIELSTGAWYDPDVPGELHSLDLHGNPNVLTPDRGTSKLGQGPTAHSTLVEVERYSGEAPKLRVFQKPTVMPKK